MGYIGIVQLLLRHIKVDVNAQMGVRHFASGLVKPNFRHGGAGRKDTLAPGLLFWFCWSSDSAVANQAG